MLLTLQPDDRRAQEQLKKRYVTLGRWDDLEVFYAESGKWDEFIRVLESNESARDRRRAAHRHADEDRRALDDPEGQARSRGARLREGPELDANNLAAAERLIPIYAQREQPEGARAAHRGQAQPRRGAGRAARAAARGREPLRDALNDKPKAFERYLSAFEIAPGDEQSQADVERAAQLTGSWDDVDRGVPDGDRSADDAGDASTAIALRLRLGRVLRRGGRARRRRARRVPRRLRERAGERRRARRARAASTGRPSAGASCSTSTRRSASSRRPRRAQAHPLRDRQALREPARRRRAARSRPIRPCSRTTRPTRRRSRRSTRSTSRPRTWEPYADVLRRRIELDVDEATLIDLKFRLAQTRSDAPRRRPAARSRTTARSCSSIGDHEGARLALEGMLENKELRGEAAAILESIYEARERLGEADRGARDPGRDGDDEAERKVALLRKIARDRRRAARRTSIARSTHRRARSKEDPSLAESRVELEQLARAGRAPGTS